MSLKSLSIVVAVALFNYCASADATTIQSRDTLISCLQAIPDSTLASPGTPAYNTGKLPFNLRLPYSPAAIVYPNSTQAVSGAVKCAVKHKVSVSARSGGHSYAAYGLGGKNGSLVVDLHALNSVTVDSKGYAVSQTGNTLGSLAQKIWDQGKRALPHGTCPYVGTGGHASFGGFGPYSRIAGLLLDRTRSAEVVLANGTIVTASSTSNPDLFWAIRGAGPSFGIITAWTFATLPAPPSTINWKIDFATSLTQPAMVSTMIAFQAWVDKGVPDELGLSITHGADPDSGTVFLEFYGSWFGDAGGLDKALKGLIAGLPKEASLTTTGPFSNWIEGLVDADGSLDTTPPETPNTFFVKSYMNTKSISNATWANWINYIYTAGLNASTLWFSEIDLYGGGGAISRVPSTSTAFVNRNAQFTFQLYAMSKNHNPPFPSDGIAFVDNMLATITTDAQAAYPNYVDPTLSPAQWKHQYFGTNYPRLASIRKRYDPNRVFAFPQEIV